MKHSRLDLEARGRPTALRTRPPLAPSDREYIPASSAGRGHGRPCRREKVAGTGTEQTRFRSGKQGVESSCDAECDAILPDRVELLTRAVVLVAGMSIPEAARDAVLARVVADLTSPTQRIPE